MNTRRDPTIVVDRQKFAVTYSKMMGFITGEQPEKDEALKCLTVVFVNSKGERVDSPAIDRPAKNNRVIEHQRGTPEVKFVR